MLTPDNIYKINFDTKYGSIWVPHLIIFNITQITEEEVWDLIKSGEWDEDDRIIELRPNQIKYLQDKED